MLSFDFLTSQGPTISGALFGAAWWFFADAIVYSKLVLGTDITATVFLPGIVATAAFLMMSCAERGSSGAYFSEEAAECRSKCSLMMAYITSVGALAAAVAILFVLKQQQQDLLVGAGTVVQSALILGSGLVLWLTKSSSSQVDDYL